jgi:hypothetical protein
VCVCGREALQEEMPGIAVSRLSYFVGSFGVEGAALLFWFVVLGVGVCSLSLFLSRSFSLALSLSPRGQRACVDLREFICTRCLRGLPSHPPP